MERNLDIGNIYIRESKGHYGRIYRIWNDRTATDENASYIALASLDSILALLAQRDDLAAELAGLTGDGWVSVEKVLPEHGEEVWCVCNFGVCYAIARIDYDNKLYFTDPIPGTFAYENVTYWMPKPSPPQTATEEK
jgi:hypothetical protein